MALQYKIDILAALKEKGYNTNRIRTESLLSQSTLQKFREKKGISWENIETLCKLLDCQPGDLMEYVRDQHKVRGQSRQALSSFLLFGGGGKEASLRLIKRRQKQCNHGGQYSGQSRNEKPHRAFPGPQTYEKQFCLPSPLLKRGFCSENRRRSRRICRKQNRPARLSVLF